MDMTLVTLSNSQVDPREIMTVQRVTVVGFRLVGRGDLWWRTQSIALYSSPMHMHDGNK